MAYVPRHKRHVPHHNAMTYAPPHDAMAYPPPHNATAYVPRHNAMAYVPRHNVAYVPRHNAMAYVPRHDAMAYVPPQDAMAYVPPQDAMAYVPPQDAMAYPPRHDAMAYPPPHDAMAYVPRHNAMAYVPRHNAMAYVPRHKRRVTHHKWRRIETEGRTLTRDLLVTEFKNNHDLSPSKNFYNKGYAKNAIRRWIPIGLGKDEQIPSWLQLQPFSAEDIEQYLGVKTLGLVNTTLDSAEVSQARSEARSEHWLSIAENVLQDLVSSFEVVRNKMKGQNSEVVKPVLRVKLGKMLFYNRDPSKTPEVVGCSPTKASLRYMKRAFYGHIVESHMDRIKREVIPNIGVEFLQEKSIYHVVLSDTLRPGSVIACRCGVAKGASSLVLYKLQSDRLHHMIVDISCLNKNLDLRLTLFSKRSIKILSKEERKSITNPVQSEVPDDNGRSGFLTEEEMKSITDLVTSAVPDGNVKGGIRWPFGQVSSGDRFRVDNAWHTVSKIYESPSIRLKWRHADRIDYRTSIGQVASEVSMKLKGVASALLEQKLDMDSIANMLKGDLKLIWEHFLSI